MKILHLSGEPEDFGGVLSVIRNLQTATEHLGWIHVVAVQSQYKELRKPSLRYWRSRRICSDSPNHSTLFFRALWSYFEVKRFLKQESFDIVHVHSRGTFLTGLAIALRLARPVVYTNHGYSTRVNMYRWGAEARNFHTVVLTQNMAKHYRLVPEPAKVTIISECCSDQFFEEPLVESRSSSNQDNGIRLIGIGNIMRWKNWHLIAEAMSRMKPEDLQRLQFSLWGPTPNDPDSLAYDRELRAHIEQFKLENHFLLRGMTLSVSDRLREADWFVLPSTNEPCSVALIEALALGLPALVSGSGGNVDIIQDGKTGLLFTPDNPTDLAAKLGLIAKHSVRIVEPNQIRASVRHRSASEVAKEYGRLFHDIRK